MPGSGHIMQQQDAITRLDAVSLMQAIRQRDVSCEEVMHAYLQRIAALNPVHNALVALEDPEILLAQARALDQSSKNAPPRGLLYGFPQAPKDLMPVKGMRSTRGSLLFKDDVATEDAVAFARLRTAGALFVGRSNTPEFGLGGHTYNPVYGITRNAHDPAVSAGGSSGGAAVAVATHMLPVADGSDMMGSLRTPAAFNAVFGLRTTPGLIVHGTPDPEVTPALSVSGPMARTIPDLALLLAVQADFPEHLAIRPDASATDITRAVQRDMRGLKAAWLGDLSGHLPFEGDLLQRCEHALPMFSQTGCQVEAVTPDFDFEMLWRAWIDLRSFAFFRSNRESLLDPARRALTKPEAQWEFARGGALSTADVNSARQVREQWRACVNELFSRYDYLLMPTAQVYPFQAEAHWPKDISGQTMDTYHRWMQAVIPATMAAIPSLSVPVGHSQGRHAAGIQILARPQAELAAMQLAHAYDQVRLAAHP